ncbi:MAG TPA: squalene--hopene cyclase [Acidimicrobiales bacterium]
MTSSDPAGTAARPPVEASLEAAVEHLLSLQSAEGWWKAELETNVTMDAEDMMLRHYLGIVEPGPAAETARWIRSNQQTGGTWSTFRGGPPDLSTTVEAYVALRLAGDEPGDAHMLEAANWIRESGGIEASRVFTRIWMAVLGVWDWEDLPVIPPEVMFLPARAPLNIYDFACWARQTIVALTVVMAHRPSRPLPFSVEELLSGKARSSRTRASIRSTAGRFAILDALLHRYERIPGWVLPKSLIRKAAVSKAERWILRRQEADGLWGGIQPPVVYSIIALDLLGYPLDHPVLQAAFRGIDGFTIRDERGRRLEACQSPVWDTALAVVALRDAGVDEGDPSLKAAARWLVGEEIQVRGDWAIRRPLLQSGGWAFEFANDNYPDIDDTAEVIMALRRVGGSAGPDGDAACERGVEWTLGMQCKDAGWGAFDVDNDSRLIAKLPFCDFGEVTDPPSADVTAHVLEMLAAERQVAPEVVNRASAWLWRQQEPDGSWFGRWGVNYIYGTGAAVPALIEAGAHPDDPRIRQAVQWLEQQQNPDGGWGEDIRSYVDDNWRGRGDSTPSQTAWALLALIAAGDAAAESTRRGVQWLVEHQTTEGTWDEPWFTGTGFPWDFSINYHLYRLVWPVMALGRYVTASSTASANSLTASRPETSG